MGTSLPTQWLAHVGGQEIVLNARRMNEQTTCTNLYPGILDCSHLPSLSNPQFYQMASLCACGVDAS
jgi:hypothetical protein